MKPPSYFPITPLRKNQWLGHERKIGADTSYRVQGRVEVPSSEDLKLQERGSNLRLKTQVSIPAENPYDRRSRTG